MRSLAILRTCAQKDLHQISKLQISHESHGKRENLLREEENRLEDHAISCSAGTGTHLDSAGKHKFADPALERSKAQTFKQGGELGG